MNILDPSMMQEDREINSLRPVALNEFYGQAQIKRNLATFIQAAQLRDEAIDHIFLSGPPGLGKTTLATIVARELHSELRITSAPALEKPKDLAGFLTTIRKKGVFFIDEIHRLRPAIEEMLYTVMEEYALDWVIGQGPAARTVRIPVPPCTLVGATTRSGLVSEPLRTRFGIHFRLDYYAQEEIMRILVRSADILSMSLTEEAIELLAQSCRGTPRIANRLLRRMRDFAQVSGKSVIDESLVQLTLKRLNIDDQGLEEQDRRLLKTIITSFRGGPVGAQSLAVSLGESIDSIEYYYEPYLIRQGFLQRTAQGRVATAKAYALLGIPLEHPDDPQKVLF